jgi:hypothetical protein
MFDLNQQIAQWRQSLGQSETLVRSDLDELESHLRDQIDHLSLSGLTSEEAFFVACRRIGSMKILPAEFAKVNGSSIFRRRLQWMLAGILVYLLILNLAYLASMGSTVVAYMAGFQGYALGAIGQCTEWVMAMVAVGSIIVAMKSRSTARLVGSAGGGMLFGLVIIVGAILLIAARLGMPMLAARCMGVQDYGQITMVQNIAGMAYSLVVPILVVTVLLLLRSPVTTDDSTAAHEPIA